MALRPLVGSVCIGSSLIYSTRVLLNGRISTGETMMVTTMMARRAAAAAATRTGPAAAWRLLPRSATTSCVRPVSITLLKAPAPSPSFRGLELDYNGGEKRFTFSAEFLRVYSPSADSRGLAFHASGKGKVVSGRKHIQILGVEPVGNYGIRIIYDDMHNTGIYTWSFLHNLGTKKFSYQKEYIRSLREHGLSRNPTKRK